KQLHTKTSPELAKWFRMAINADWFDLTTTSIASNAPGHEKTWRCDLIPWSENNTEAFQGLHNEGKRILLIFDEASKIADPSWEGDDEFVIGIRTGLWFQILATYPKNDNDVQMANIVMGFEDEYGADAVFVDGGFGTGIVSVGHTLGRDWILVWFGERSSDV